MTAPLVDISESGIYTHHHSGAAVIMLVSIALMCLVIFAIYKFKRYSHLIRQPNPYATCRVVRIR